MALVRVVGWVVDFIDCVVVHPWSLAVGTQNPPTTNDNRLTIFSRIFERIHHRLFDSYLFKMRFPEPTLHHFVYGDTQIFRSRHVFSEFWSPVQILMVVPLQDMLMHE